MFKPIRMSDQTSFVSPSDPAIDIEATGEAALEEYGKTARKDPSCWKRLLKMKPGEQPAVFDIGVVDPGEFSRIIDECGLALSDHSKVHPAEASWRFFLAGLRGIQNWPETPPTVNRNGVSYVDPAWLAKAFVRGLRAVANDVGLAIYHWNQITEDEVKN